MDMVPENMVPESTLPENDVSQLVAVEAVEEPKTPWGFWMTMLLSFLVLVVLFAVQTGVALLITFIALALGKIPSVSDPAVIEKFVESGWMLAAATWASLPFTLGAIYLSVRLRKRWTFREYLGWNRVPFAHACFWLAAVAVYCVANDLCTWLLGGAIVPDWMKNVSETALWLPLVWITMLVAAPLFEECFFRGFFFRGLQASALGNVGAIVITSLVWAVIHLQYDRYQIAGIFLGGCLLGTARAVTGSCKLTIGMHFLWNLGATLEFYLFS